MLSGLLQILVGCNADPLPAVTHHVRGASHPNWMGHDQVRSYRVDSSHPVLSPLFIGFRGESLEYILR
jgi:hypothetical protein